MRLRFWGTRGSLPVALDAEAVRRKLVTVLLRASGRIFTGEADANRFLDAEIGFAGAGTFGGNSSCVQVEAGSDEFVLCDAGSGLRVFGSQLVASVNPPGGQVFNILMSHVHWDHIMGFPFFVPAYVPGNLVRIFGCHDIEGVLHEAFRRQQSFPCFPVDFSRLGARIEFVPLQPERDYEIGGFRVRARVQDHPYDSFGYRIEKDGHAFVYSTDSEHRADRINENYPQVDFFRDADVVIFDAQYSLADAMWTKEDWGHSSNIIGVELCHLAAVKHLVLFHHEPGLDDEALETILRETIRFEALARRSSPLRVSAAYDGMVIEIK